MSSSGDEALAQKTHGDDRVVVMQTLHAFAPQIDSIIILEAGVTGTVLKADATGTAAIAAAFEIEGIGTRTACVPLSALNKVALQLCVSDTVPSEADRHPPVGLWRHRNGSAVMLSRGKYSELEECIFNDSDEARILFEAYALCVKNHRFCSKQQASGKRRHGRKAPKERRDGAVSSASSGC